MINIEQPPQSRLMPQRLKHVARTCSICLQSRAGGDFYRWSRQCKRCLNDRRNNRRATIGRLECDKREKPETKRARNKRYIRKPATLIRLVQGARYRARRQGIEFSITIDDLPITPICPLLGVPLKAGKRAVLMSVPSIDRIDPRLGYIPGNVWIISYRANLIKHDASLEELERLVAALRRKIKSQ